MLSADAVERYKPARQAYDHAAKKLNVKPNNILLIAAHSWDIAGAMAAGCEAGFVARPEKVLSPGGPKPKYEAVDLSALADRVIADRS